MRAQLWPGCEFWYQVSLLGILLLPYAYYRFILAFGGEKNGLSGRIYFVIMLICFWVNALPTTLLLGALPVWQFWLLIKRLFPPVTFPLL